MNRNRECSELGKFQNLILNNTVIRNNFLIVIIVCCLLETVVELNTIDLSIFDMVSQLVIFILTFDPGFNWSGMIVPVWHYQVWCRNLPLNYATTERNGIRAFCRNKNKRGKPVDNGAFYIFIISFIHNLLLMCSNQKSIRRFLSTFQVGAPRFIHIRHGRIYIYIFIYLYFYS